MAYMDSAGLYNKYGTEQTVPSTGGEYVTTGELREIEIKINLANLTVAETIQNDNLFVPAGMVIQEVEIYTDVAAATGVAIDLGLTRTDRSTEIDFDGILAAYTTASMTAGSKVVLVKGSSLVGALVGGSALANVGQISCSATTSTAFTAGTIRVRIRYFRP